MSLAGSAQVPLGTRGASGVSATQLVMRGARQAALSVVLGIVYYSANPQIY